MKIFSGSSNQPLAKKIAKILKIKMGNLELSKFPNGEARVWIKEDVNGQDCVVVQSFSPFPNSMIIELLLIIDGLVRAGAAKIFAIIPWLAYSLQDKVFRTGEPIAAKVISRMISASGVARIFTVDLHNDSVAGFFEIPVMHYSARQLFVDYIKKEIKNNAVVVSPDFGAMKRSRLFAQDLKLEQIAIDKERDRATGELTIHGISSPVKGKTCLIFDDLINTGRTVVSVARTLKAEGARAVYFFATHHLYLKEAITALSKSSVDKVIVTDSIAPQQKSEKKLTVLSLAPIFVEGIKKWL